MTRRSIVTALALGCLVAMAAPMAHAQSAPASAATGQSKPGDGQMRLLFYADLTSEGAARQAVVLRAFADRHPGQIVVDVHHRLPAGVEPQSRLADLAVAAAAQQARGWDMAQLLLANLDRHSRADLHGMARQLELDVTRFDAALASGDVVAAVAADAARSASMALPAGATVVMGDAVMDAPTLAALDATFRKLTSGAQ